MYLYILFFLVFIVCYIYKFYADLRNWPPGPTPLPLIGNLHQVNFRDVTQSFARFAERYGPIYRLSFPQHLIIITDADLIKEALLKHGDSFSGRPAIASMRILNDGDHGVLMNEGPVWRETKRFALHALRDMGFGRNQMETKIQHTCNNLVADMMTHANTGEPYDITEDLCCAVGDVISDVLMGHTFRGEHRARLIHLRHLLDKNMELALSPMTRVLDLLPTSVRYIPILNWLCNVNFLVDSGRQLREFFTHEIQAHRARLQSGGRPGDFLDALLVESEKRKTQGDHTFSDHHMAVTMFDLWLAGMETTITTLRWGFSFMAKNAEIQRKIREEINHVIAQETPTMADSQRMPYTTAAVMEMQRCANIVSFNVLHRSTEDVELCGHLIPGNTIVGFEIGNVLWDEKLFPDPHRYDPERFLEWVDGELTVKHMDKLTPFGMGKRQCLGESLARMELFLMFVSVLQKFELRAVCGEKLPDHDDVILGITRVPVHYKVSLVASDL